VTPFDGIKASSKGGEEVYYGSKDFMLILSVVTYAKGCERWSNDESGFAEAVATASAADIAVVVVGTWSVSITNSH
jgi:beta-glucosidase